MPTLLTFNLAPQKRAALQVVALRCGCRIQAVPPERFGATLAQLLSGQEGQTAPEETFGEELLVMDGLDQRRLDAVLSELRRRKIHIPLKAVVTPTNALWTPGELYAELCREREAIARGGPIHK